MYNSFRTKHLFTESLQFVRLFVRYLLYIIKARKHESGITINEKFFHLDELGQAIVFTLQNHEERLNKTEQNIENLMKDMSIVLKENKELKERLKELELLNTKITV